jgi:isopentenyldiphosphate isomerase
MDPGDAPVDVVDEEDRVVGVATRREVVADRLLHRCTYALIRRSDDRIHVQRRTDTKDMWPGAHDMLPGGVCDAGEGYDDCIRRELAEEVGIEGIEPRFLLKHRYSGPDGEAWGAVYAATWDGPVVHQAEEVAWSAWVTADELDAMIARETFCADSLEIYERLRTEGLVPDLTDTGR